MAEIKDIIAKLEKISADAADAAKEAATVSVDSAATAVQVSGVDPFVFGFTVFIMACFVGYYVVWSVTPALHTPLMSVTNAISGIIVVGAMIAVGPEQFTTSKILGFAAVVLASINIFGGFVVTHRMLAMFKKKEK